MVRGEIWWASLHKPRGSEPGFRRPLLIVQADAFNRSKINTVVCAVITSNTSLASAPGNILLNKQDSNLSKDSVVNISQIVTVDKRYLSECVGSVPRKILLDVESGMRLILGL